MRSRDSGVEEEGDWGVGIRDWEEKRDSFVIPAEGEASSWLHDWLKCFVIQIEDLWKSRMYRHLYLTILIIAGTCLSCGVLFHGNEDKATAAWERAIKASRTITPPYDETVVRAMKVADSVRVEQKFDSVEVVLHRVSEDDTLLFFTY